MLLRLTIIFAVMVACTVATSLTGPQARSAGGRIINGRAANDGEFPYQVSLQRKFYFGDGSSHMCGGVIIDEHHILTAGHCIYGQFISELLVVAGARDLSFTTDPNRVNLTVEQAYLHENFNISYYFNDIALVRVSPGFPVDSAFIQPVSLRAQRLHSPATCIVTGWGNTRQLPYPYPDILQALDLPFIDYDVCTSLYEDYEDGYFIPGMLCAGYIEGRKDACDGDSGGALVCGGQLSGLVSWGEDCAQPDYPGIYADIAYYKEWIELALGRSYEDGGFVKRFARS